MTFKELNITEPILKAIEEKGYAVPTPIQGEAIPAALAKREAVRKREQVKLLRLLFPLYNICK